MNRCLSLLESLNQRSRTGSPAHRKASFEWFQPLIHPELWLKGEKQQIWQHQVGIPEWS